MNTEEYFPYIGHTLDKEFLEEGHIDFLTRGKSIKEFYFGDTFENCTEKNAKEDREVYQGNERSLFSKITVKGASRYREIKENSNNVIVTASRHRSLADFIIGQPVHYHLISKDLMLLAGDNLFLGPFSKIMRDSGAVMFLRDDKQVSAEGKESIFLTTKKYQSILSAYLKEQMGGESNVPRHDLIVFPEISRSPEGAIIGGGRTKTGYIGDISPMPYAIIDRALKKTDTKIFVAPVDISLSKYPDALFLNDTTSIMSKLPKPARYLFELNYIFKRYPNYTYKDQNAMIDATVTYSEPIRLSDMEGRQIISKGGEDSLSHKIKRAIGESETVYPTTLLCRAMNGNDSITVGNLDEKVSYYVNRLNEKGIDTTNVSDDKGNPKSGEAIFYGAKRDLNSNPILFLHLSSRSKNVLTYKNGEIRINNPALQNWYGNMLRHLV